MVERGGHEGRALGLPIRARRLNDGPHYVAAAVLSVIAFVIIATACTNSDSSSSLVNRTERLLSSQTIGVEGGRVEAANIKLDVPPGALAAPTLITLSAIDDLTTIKLPPKSQVLGSVAWVIGPTSLSLAKPASVEIKIEPQSSSPFGGNQNPNAAVLFRAEPRTNEWNAGGAATLNGSTLKASIERARDVVATITTTTCFSHITCDFKKVDDQGRPGTSTCSIRAGSAGVVCTRPGGNLSSTNATCVCDGTNDVVATGALPNSDPAFFGALAMLCGAQCVTQKTCMPVVSLFEDFAVSFPDNDIRWGADVKTSKDTLSCALDNAPQIKVNCTCNSKGPLSHGLSLVQPTADEMLKLWNEQCDTSCP